MSDEATKEVDAAFRTICQAQSECIQHIDRSLNCSGHPSSDFATVVLTVHRKTGTVCLGADMSEESAVRLMSEAATQTAMRLQISAQRKVMEN